MTTYPRLTRALSDATAGISTLPPRWGVHVPCRDDVPLFDAALEHLESKSERQRRSADVVAAKKMCRACPMRDRCEAWAIEHFEHRGVWGATTPQERASIHRRRTRKTGRKALR